MQYRNALVLSFLVSSVLFAYIVKEDDTLWDLSDEYLKDPFQWTFIWENNPQVTNPHLIYPGDEITLDGKPAEIEPTLEAIPEVETPIDQNADSLPKGVLYNGRGIKERLHEDFLNRLGPLGETYMEQEDDLNELKSALPDTLAYRPQPRILKPALQVQAPYLVKPFSDYRTFSDEFNISPELKTTGTLLKWGEDFIIEAGTKIGINEGDTIELFYHTRDRIEVNYNKKEKEQLCVVRPQALAVIKSTSESRSRAQMLKTFGPVSQEHSRGRLYKKRALRYVNYYNPVKTVELNRMGIVTNFYDDSDIVKFNNWIGINKGASNGYRPGDAIHIIENSPGSKLKPRVIATGMVIVSQERTASILINNVLYPARNIKLSDRVAIVQKAME